MTAAPNVSERVAVLRVEPLGDDRYRVTGGAKPHVVRVEPDAVVCDCADFAYRGRQRPCKHVRVVKEHRRRPVERQAALLDRMSDEDVLEMLGPADDPRTHRHDGNGRPATDAPTFRLLDDVEIEAEPEPDWQIADVLPADAFAVLYGPSEGGKSFLALDWALSVASGQPWRGRTVTAGPVVYVAAEGWSGIKRRVCAWKRARGVTGRVGVCFLSGAVNLMDWAEVIRLLAAIREKLGGEPVLVVFDTLNQSLRGDENASKDMGLVIANAQQLRRDTGATVLLVHHCRRQDEEERGHGSLRNAADTMLQLTIGDDDARVLSCTKQRNAGYFDAVRFTLEPAGDSLVIADAPAPGHGPGHPLSKSQEHALTTLHEIATDDGVPFSRWEAACGLKPRTFAVAVKALVESGRAIKGGTGRTGRYRIGGDGHALPF